MTVSPSARRVLVARLQPLLERHGVASASQAARAKPAAAKPGVLGDTPLSAAKAAVAVAEAVVAAASTPEEKVAAEGKLAKMQELEKLREFEASRDAPDGLGESDAALPGRDLTDTEVAVPQLSKKVLAALPAFAQEIHNLREAVGAKGADGQDQARFLAEKLGAFLGTAVAHTVGRAKLSQLAAGAATDPTPAALSPGSAPSPLRRLAQRPRARATC